MSVMVLPFSPFTSMLNREGFSLLHESEELFMRNRNSLRLAQVDWVRLKIVVNPMGLQSREMECSWDPAGPDTRSGFRSSFPPSRVCSLCSLPLRGLDATPFFCSVSLCSKPTNTCACPWHECLARLPLPGVYLVPISITLRKWSLSLEIKGQSL